IDFWSWQRLTNAEVRATPCDRVRNLHVGYALAGSRPTFCADEITVVGYYSTPVTTAKQMLVPVLGHPPGAGQVGVPGTARPLGLAGRIDVQHDGRHLGPVRPLGLGVEKA